MCYQSLKLQEIFFFKEKACNVKLFIFFINIIKFSSLQVVFIYESNLIKIIQNIINIMQNMKQKTIQNIINIMQNMRQKTIQNIINIVPNMRQLRS